jgi:hypothetical protein
VRVAVLLGAPVPPGVELTGPVILFFVPTVVPLTFTDTVQLEEIAPPLRLTEVALATAVNIPPQPLETPGGLATCRPLGRESVKESWNSGRPKLELLIWKMSTEVPPTTMLFGENVLVIVAGLATTSVAVLLVVPVPPSVELTAPVTLFLVPGEVPFTLTESVHELAAATVPPVRLTDELPAVLLKVPPQLFTRFGLLATCTPAGKVSAKATPVSVVAEFGLVMVKLNVEVAFTAMLAGEKPLLMVGGATTVTLAEAVLPVPPLVEVTAPVVLFLTPAAVPVTFTFKVQEELAATLAPDRLITPEPAVPEAVPPQVLVSPLGVEITRPDGSVSLKPTPLSVVVPLLFWMVKPSKVEPFRGIVAAPKALLIAGGPTTVMEAIEMFPDPPSVEVT